MPAEMSPSWGIRWRSKPSFVVATVAMALFTDLFLYGIVVPVVPFMLRDRLLIPEAEIQAYTSQLLAVYSGASVLFALPAGWITDMVGSRQPPFLAGLISLLIATVLLAFGNSIAVLMLARLLQGVSASVVWTAGLAMVQDTVGPGQIGRTIGTIFSIITVGALVAPVVGGMLYDSGGFAAVFAVATAILFLDFAMRVLVIEDKTILTKSSCIERHLAPENTPGRGAESDESGPHEHDTLLPKDDVEAYRIHGNCGRVVQAIPVLYCFREPRLVVAMFVSFVQMSIMGVFDATVPTEAESLFHFSSHKVGLLFIALFAPYLALGHVCGTAVDRYGTKVVATTGFAFLAPCLALLGLPSQEVITGGGNVALFCVALALNGVGSAMIGTPSFVEASDVVARYHAANPGFFGASGPFSQLYGFNALFLFTGLAVGPLVGGFLRVNFGYGVMTVTFGVISALTAVLTYFVLGTKVD